MSIPSLRGAALALFDRLDGPIGYSMERAFGRVYGHVVFRSCQRDGAVAAMGDVRIVGGAGIRLGDRTFFLDGLWPTSLVCHPGARIEVGDATGFNYGVHVEARERVSIGSGCLFASGVRISDCDGGRVAPVVIEDNVWIAHGAVIRAGVTIGRGSVVSAGSVVTSSVPPDRVAIGNPARAMPRKAVAGVRARPAAATAGG